MPLDTLAAAYAAAGRFAEAARQEEQALRVAAPSRQADYARRLEAYRQERSPEDASLPRR